MDAEGPSATNTVCTLLKSVLLLSDLFAEFFIQTFPNRCEFGSRTQHVPGARGWPGLPTRCPAGALMRVAPGPAGPARTGRSWGWATAAGRRRGRGEPGPGPAAQHNAPQRREPRSPPPQLCAASPAARPRPSARPPPRPPPSRPPPLTVAELEQRGRVVQAAVAREAVLHAEAAGQRPLPRPGRAAAAHPHTEPPEPRPALGAGAGPAVAAAAGYHGNPGPAAAAAGAGARSARQGAPAAGTWPGGARGGVAGRAEPAVSPEPRAGVLPSGRGCCCGSARSRSAFSRRARRWGRGDKGELGGQRRRGRGRGTLPRVLHSHLARATLPADAEARAPRRRCPRARRQLQDQTWTT